MNEIQLSEGFAQRLIEAQFNSLEVKGWVRSFMTWLIDSKYRTYKRLDSFLKEQLENPSKELRNCVKDIKGQDSPNHDELIINILNFVVEKITYQTDEKRYGTEEYWGTSGETLKGYADCEGFNSLVYLLARACGVPSYLIWCCIGEINVPTSGDYIGYNTGHFWCLYYSLEKRKLYAIDGTSFVDLRDMGERMPFVISEYRYRKIYYVFNENFIFRCVEK